jgi:SulP family sulfate permease
MSHPQRSKSSATASPVVSRKLPHPSEFLAGFVTSLVGLVYSISCAALVYSGNLTPWLSYGMVSSLVTAVVLGLAVAWRSSLPFAVAGPDTRAAAILAVAVSAVAAKVGGTNPMTALWLTVMTSGLSTGVILFLLGRFKASRFIRFIPYPAVGGFLAGTGWLLVTGAYKVMTGQALMAQPMAALMNGPSTPIWLVGLGYALVVLAATRLISHYLTLPLLVICGVGVAYAVALGSGVGVSQARDLGWFFDMPAPVSFWEPWQQLQLDPSLGALILSQGGNFVALAMVMAITILLSATGLELKTRQDANLDLELQVNGWGNLLSGMAGGMAGCLSINRTLLNYQAGARTRLAGVLVALVCAAVLAFQWPLLSYTPKPLLGGLLLYLGLSLLHEWLILNWSRLSRVDYGIVVVILLAVASFGFLPGMLLGVVIAAISFAVNYSRINVVKHALTGSQHRSNVERSPAAERYLQEHGREIQIFWLHGYLFFGTANRLVEDARRQIRGSDGKAAAKFLILDFARVSGMDSSSVLSFAKMRQIARQQDSVILFSRVPASLADKLHGESNGSERTRTFHDVDRALEWCEDQLLENADRERTQYNGLLDLVNQQFGSNTMARAFVEYLEHLDVTVGTYLCREGEASTSLFFVERGRISVTVELANGQQKRLRSMGAGTVVGEMGLILGTPRSAAVVADLDSRVYRLTAESLRQIQLEVPEIAAAFQQFLLRLLARRLVAANGEIKALLD